MILIEAESSTYLRRAETGLVVSNGIPHEHPR